MEDEVPLEKYTDSRSALISIDKDVLAYLDPNGSVSNEKQNSQDFNIQITLNEQEKSSMFKVVLLGDASVGKTSIQRRYVHQSFSEDYLVTIGTEIAVKYEKIGHHQVKFQIWDIAGHPQFHEVRKSYYSHVSAAIIICDVTKRDSMINLNNWIKELWAHNGKGPIPFILVGNKIDLQDTNANLTTNQVLTNYIDKISSRTTKNHGFSVRYIPASAKTGENIQDIFKNIGIQIIAHGHFLERMKKRKPI
jgi:Ras-related protein Rab-5C